MKIYLLILNILAVLLYGIDKYKAKHHAFRIPERLLLMVSILGGGYGSLFAMFLFHHKTKKRKFLIAGILSCILWTLWLGGLYS